MTQKARIALFIAHRAALVDYATPIVGDRARAEDIVQEAYLRFAPEAKRDQTVQQPVAYLYRIVRNLALDLTRRNSVEQAQQANHRLWWLLPSTPRDPEQELLHRRELADVEEVLRSLPKEMRIALEMYRFGGHTLAEVASRIGVSVPTAHRLVRDALIRIADRITIDAVR